MALLVLRGGPPTRRESSAEERSFSLAFSFFFPISDLLGIELRFSKLASLCESNPWLCSWIAVSSLPPKQKKQKKTEETEETEETEGTEETEETVETEEKEETEETAETEQTEDSEQTEETGEI